MSSENSKNVGSERIKLFLEFAIVFVASYYLMVSLGSEILKEENSGNEDTQVQGVQNNGEQLQVKDSVGDPSPLAPGTLQGSDKAQQKAAGNLQTPQRASDLQPNAKLSDFPNE